MPPKGRKPPAKRKAKVAPKRAKKAAKTESAESVDSLLDTKGDSVVLVTSDSVTSDASSCVSADSDCSLFERRCRKPTGSGTHSAAKRAVGKRSRSAHSITEVSNTDAEDRDGDVDVKSEAGTRGNARGKTRQLTLDGGVSSPAARQKPGNGELPPSLPAARSAKERSGKKTPAEPKTLFLEHLRYALAKQHLQENNTSIHLTDVPQRAWDGRDEDSTLRKNPPDPLAVEGSQTKSIRSPSVYFALPCLQFFIVVECARAADMAATAGEDPLLASLMCFGFLIDLCERSNDSFNALLYMCCPASRFHGVSYSSLEYVLNYLLETKRMTATEMQTNDFSALRASIFRQMPGYVAQDRRPTRAWRGVPEHFCPCGCTHVFLSLLTHPCYDRRPQLSELYEPWPGLERAAQAAREIYKLELDVRSKYVKAARSEMLQLNLNELAHSSGRAPPQRKKSVPIVEPDFTPYLANLSHTVFSSVLQRVRSISPPSALTDSEAASRGVDLAYYNDLIRASAFAHECSAGGVKVHASFVLGMPREHAESSQAFMSAERSGEHLWMLFLANNHAVVAAQCAAAEKGKCTCKPDYVHTKAPSGNEEAAPPQTKTSARALLYMEYHSSFLQNLQRRKEAEQLVPLPEEASTTPISAVNVDRLQEEGDTEPAEQSATGGAGDAYAYYARSSFDRHQFLSTITDTFTQQQLVDYAAVESVAGVDADPAVVPRELIKAELKRHQLEDVQWMRERERNGIAEFAQLPVYSVDTRSWELQLKGAFFYCGTTGASSFLPPEGNNRTLLYSLLQNRIHSGFLGDDVGLGKTLTLLTVCANDAHEQMQRKEPMKTRGKAAKAGENDTTASLEKAPSSTIWEVHTKNRTRQLRRLGEYEQAHPLSRSFMQRVFGFSEHQRREGVRLPNTTLVVVPMSIAGQWIGEIEKFYPSAKYILFYGNKRHRYTVEDMAQADFVITTYETLAVHLRKENEGGDRLLMDRVAAEANLGSIASWTKCSPADFLQVELQAASSERLIPPEVVRRSELASSTTSADNAAAETLLHGRGRGGGRGRTKSQSHNKAGASKGSAGRGSSADSGAPQVWEMRLCSHEVEETESGMPPLERFEFKGPEYVIFAHKVTYTTPMPPDNKDCNDFLDATWETVSSIATLADSERDPFVPGLGFFHAGCITSLLTHPFESVASRRIFVQHAILPFLKYPFEAYWKVVKDRLDADTGKVAGVTITDLIFRRVILDECQKCGSNSLFFLLDGKRRWAVSGTPINNNNPATLAEPLRAIRALSASNALQSMNTLSQMRSSMSSHFLGSSNGNYLIASHRTRCSFNYIAYETKGTIAPVMNQEFYGGFFCLCPMCSANAFYGFPIALQEEMVPRMNYPPRLEMSLFGPSRDRNLNFLPSVLLQILMRFVVRHERTKEVRQDLSLRPVEHISVAVELTQDELFFYARYATAVSNVSSRLHRAGRLTNHMSQVLQWLQTLCRLALHPSAIGAHELGSLNGADIFTHKLDDNMDGIIETLEKSFVTMDASEVLSWAQDEANHPRIVKGSVMRVPKETLETLQKLADIPPEIPNCGICLDQMADPTVLACYHLFCKECLLSVIQSSISASTGNSLAKCPYCRDAGSLNDVKRIVRLAEVEDTETAKEMQEEEAKQSQTPHKTLAPDDDELDDDAGVTDDERLARIGRGSRAAKLLELLAAIWATNPGDGVLVFSKYPSALEHMHQEVASAGYEPLLMDGKTTMARRRKITSVLQQSAGQPASTAGTDRRDCRVLFVSSRAANAGLNLTFANHVIFLEPNMNPAVEVQAIGRVHRFGQLKDVKAYHLFAPGTVEELLYQRSTRILEQLERATTEEHQQLTGNVEVLANLDDVANDRAALALREQLARLGRVEATETVLLLQYPPVSRP